jgi:membrane-associated phospholipid phosphatase
VVSLSTFRRSAVVTVISAACWCVCAGRSDAQQLDPPATPPAPAAASDARDQTLNLTPPRERIDVGFGNLLKQTVADFRRLPSSRTLTLLVVGGTFAATAHQYDREVSFNLAGATASAPAFKPGAVLGGKEFQFGASLATYGLGRLTGNTRLAQVGGNLLRAQIVAQTVTHGIKYSVRRMRPDGSTRNSFPSGHTSVSFASATVLHREFGWKAGLPAYAVATYIGWSRVEHKRHFASDVLFGAAIGLMSGRSIAIGPADKRFVMAPIAARGGGGIAFTWDGSK